MIASNRINHAKLIALTATISKCKAKNKHSCEEEKKKKKKFVRKLFVKCEANKKTVGLNI